MRYWKLPEWWWDNREHHFHSDFQLDVGEQIEIRINGQIIFKRKVPKDEHWKAHLEASFQPYKNGKGGRK